jgi:hypothetical protein
MKLTQLLKENEERPLSNEVKKHFLEIVSTYNKYQESMDRKSDITQVAETLGGITEAARTLDLKEAGDWCDKNTVKRNMSELDKLGKQFDKVALEARALDQRMGGLYEDMGHILSRYYKFGEITEDEMKNRLGINEAKKFTVKKLGDDYYPYGLYYDKLGLVSGLRSNSKKEVENAIKSIQKINPRISEITKETKEDCGCGCGDSVNEETIVEQPVMVSKRTESGNIVTTLKEVSDLNEQEMKLYEFGQKVETLMEKNCPTDSSKWSSYKSQAKKKFDVYPSAYANGWAAKKYKAAGGGWKKC